jgi:hypothetical protein
MAATVRVKVNLRVNRYPTAKALRKVRFRAGVLVLVRQYRSCKPGGSVTAGFEEFLFYFN